MKPLLVKVDKDGNLKVTMEELQQMVDSSYHSGYNDGYEAGQRSLPQGSWWSTPVMYTDQGEPFRYDKITCSTDEE